MEPRPIRLCPGCLLLSRSTSPRGTRWGDEPTGGTGHTTTVADMKNDTNDVPRGREHGTNGQRRACFDRGGGPAGLPGG
eukprot:scaffold2126_cov303-Pavlova_lutheri.AAC.4